MSITLEDSARQAMRAFLQRAEVRLSTMHRIAGVFLNGAGLLLLFPIFFKDAIVSIGGALANQMALAGGSIGAVLVGLLLALVALSLFLPLYALYLLLKDLTQFYFTPHSPGFNERRLHPRFALSAIALSPDELAEGKTSIFAHQYSADSVRFLLPSAEREASQYDKIYTSQGADIVPDTRREVTGSVSEVETRRMNVAMGLAALLDRTLSEEVAVMELVLVRCAISLQRLVFRYGKALLMFIWTTLVSLSIVPLVAQPGVPLAVILVSGGAGYLTWALVTPWIIRRPIKWVWQLANRNIDPEVRDPQLLLFERRVLWLSIGGALLSLVVLLGAMWMFGRAVQT